MKPSFDLIRAVGAIALLALASGCATTTANNAVISASQKQMMLTQAGFISKTVTTPKQEQQVEKLPVAVVSAVKCKGKLLYVYPTEKKDQILVGKQAHYDSYKKMLAAQAAKAQASAARQDQAQDAGPYLTGETAGPDHIKVEEFDGFGPMPDNPAWQ